MKVKSLLKIPSNTDDTTSEMLKAVRKLKVEGICLEKDDKVRSLSEINGILSDYHEQLRTIYDRVMETYKFGIIRPPGAPVKVYNIEDGRYALELERKEVLRAMQKEPPILSEINAKYMDIAKDSRQ